MMQTNKSTAAKFLSKFSKITILIISVVQLGSCQTDDSIDAPGILLLRTITNVDIKMSGLWESGCVQANNDMILNESLTFNEDNLTIDIRGFDKITCEGPPTSSQQIQITFQSSGTTSIPFDGASVIVNKIDGTARYPDGQVENFKQVFLIDDSSNAVFMHHALFENDGGQVNNEGYPIEIIPIPIVKKN